jgi:hypothetical protein
VDVVVLVGLHQTFHGTLRVRLGVVGVVVVVVVVVMGDRDGKRLGPGVEFKNQFRNLREKTNHGQIQFICMDRYGFLVNEFSSKRIFKNHNIGPLPGALLLLLVLLGRLDRRDGRRRRRRRRTIEAQFRASHFPEK